MAASSVLDESCALYSYYTYNKPMPPSLDILIEEPESEELEKKSFLDLSNSRDMLGLVADIVALSNTRGGRVLIGTRGISLPENCTKVFDSARLDDKVNSFSEPGVRGITSV